MKNEKVLLNSGITQKRSCLLVIIALYALIGVCADGAFGQGGFQIRVPNGHYYRANGNFITTAFCFEPNCTANYVVLDCLDDNSNDAGNETFEVAITTDKAGTIVLASAQITNNFKNTGGCDRHRYLFDFSDVALTGGVTYYLRTKVLAGAPARFWGGCWLYYDNGMPTGKRKNVGVPNGTTYPANNSFITTAFSFTQTSTARYVILDCLDDDNSPDTEPDTETFEVAITTDSAGTAVISSAQLTRDFGCVYGNCDRRRHLFDLGDVSLTGGVTYYLRTKVLAGAPVRFWGGSHLYYYPSSNYMKIDLPPDADKTRVNDSNSCWLATAANMLAGAGYGGASSVPVQTRADTIYTQLKNNWPANPSGWISTALNWWLGSIHNTWPQNPYDDVVMRGNTSRVPWANSTGAQFIGNRLRRCEFVGLSVSWPRKTANGSASNGHAFTAWGDNSGGANLTTNPTQIRCTDSDKDTGGNVQVYTYDSYTNPNPNGFNEGNGWYLNYSTNHPFIKHIVTLQPITEGCDEDGDGTRASRTDSSYKVNQTRSEYDANALHYEVGTYNNLLNYETSINWGDPNNIPSIEQDDSPARFLTVDCNLEATPVPYGQWVTINNEFVVPDSCGIKYGNIKFIYPEGEIVYPGFEMEVYSWPAEVSVNEPNVIGGYLIGAFDIIDTNDANTVVGEHRFLHEYKVDQDPERHTIRLYGTECNECSESYVADNFRFGHLYGFVEPASLWEFEEWMTQISQPCSLVPGGQTELEVDWDGLLPYPEADGPVPIAADLNGDCKVDLLDLKIMAEQWLNESGTANLFEDDRINFLDFATFATEWLSTCP